MHFLVSTAILHNFQKWRGLEASFKIFYVKSHQVIDYFNDLLIRRSEILDNVVKT